MSLLGAERTATRRRQIAVVITLLIGGVLLGFSLATAPGDATFYLLTTALALVWIAGGLASGPLHLGTIAVAGRMRRPVLAGLVVGVAAAAVFVLGALVLREIAPLRHLVEDVLAHARRGSLILVALVTAANGVAEEIFFRGAVFAALGERRPVLFSTIIYTVVTLATGNLLLTFAAASLGIVLALERRNSGGILASCVTHVTWSLIMLFALPPLFR